jgi:DNA polymerase elongation subunit (family B)
MQNCRHCGGKKWLKTDEKTKDGLRRWKCWRCGYVADGDRQAEHQEPKILYLDVEIGLSEYYNFGGRVPSKYLSYEFMKHPYFIICWAASWLWSDEVYSGCVTQRDAMRHTDARILPNIWELINSADLCAGHNIDNFDAKRLNTRFLKNKMKPPEPYRTLDTLKIARSKMAFESNALDAICMELGLRAKDDMSRGDWIKIAEMGDAKTLLKMQKYNIQDVKAGKEVLEALLPWSGKYLDYGVSTGGIISKRR